LTTKETFSSTSFSRFKWVMTRDTFQAKRNPSGVPSRHDRTTASVGVR